MGDYDNSFSRAPSNDDFQISTEKILVACLETGSLVATTQRLNISERCVVFVVKKHLEENQSFFESGCEDLQLTATDFHSRLLDVWGGLFNDNIINWGRVLTMLCFCRVISIHSQRIGIHPSAAESIAPWAANFICTSQLKDWIISEGGWVRFWSWPCINTRLVKYFQQQKP